MPRLKMRSECSGFSLSELLVAMFVMVVGISGVVSSIYWGLQKTDSGRYVTQASDLARVLTETFVARGLIAQNAPWPTAGSGINDQPEERKPVFDPPFQDLTVVGDGFTAYDSVIQQRDITKYTRNISTVRLANVGETTGPPGNESGYLSEMALLSVRIYWDEKGHQRNIKLETIISHGLE